MITIFSSLGKLFRSSTFTLGALANVLVYAQSHVLSWPVLVGSVLAYGLKEAGAHIGAQLPAPAPMPETRSSLLTRGARVGKRRLPRVALAGRARGRWCGDSRRLRCSKRL